MLNLDIYYIQGSGAVQLKFPKKFRYINYFYAESDLHLNCGLFAFRIKQSWFDNCAFQTPTQERQKYCEELFNSDIREKIGLEIFYAEQTCSWINLAGF